MSNDLEQKHPVSVAIPGHVCVAHATTQLPSAPDVVVPVAKVVELVVVLGVRGSRQISAAEAHSVLYVPVVMHVPASQPPT